MHESLDADSLAEDLLDDALLALLQDELPEPDRIAPRESAGPAPLSFAQQRLWYLQQFNPQSAAYNLPRALSLKGELHGQQLAMALQAVVDRHDILRSRFAEVEGIPQQFVEADARLEMPCEDLTAMPATQRPHALQRLIEADALAPFDLGKAPLIRARLVKVQGDEHVLLLNMHHIVSDAWSNPILLQDLLGAYSQAAAQGACKLQRPAIQYADYAIWQRQAYLQSDACQASARYWHTRLGDELQPLMLPGDLDPRCAGVPPEGTSARYHGLQLDAEVFQALLQLSRQQGVQPFVIALAAWQVLLGRYSGQRQFTLGVPSAGRNRSETQQLVGFFVSTQIYRAELDPQQSVQTLLQNLREQSIAALSHSDYPMELYLETLQHNGQVLPTQLFQALFNWRVAGTASGPLALGPLQLDFLDTASAQAKCLIGIDLEYAADGLGFSLEYDCSQFSHATVQRMARHWQNLLLAMARGPEQRLGELDMLGTLEQQATFAQWNPAPAEHPADQALHSRIEAQVQRTPDAIAVTCEGQALSYAQLNQRANALARRLVDDGVGPDVLVGLAAERSLDMVVGIFAILKAGGAYVPLDPAYPADRLAYMIEDSGLQRVLAQPQVLASLPVPAGVRVLSLESNDDSSQADPLACSPVTVSPDNLAYVIYTSGSTGKPKGVLLPQRNVLRLFTATDADFRFGSDDVWSLFHSYAFDFSVWEIFGALLYGGRLVIVPQHTSRSPEAFYQLLADEQVTVLNQTPSAFKQLMAVATTAEPQRPLALRSVVFGGEALDVNSLAPWFERFGDRQPQLVNMYGITETTVHVSYRPLSLADLGKAASSPMGVPIPDLSWYVLDGDLNPVAKGCIGELYVGRAGLARGYLKRSDLSATRFVPDPFGAPGGRLYRTGDLARYHADGVIEYAGRIDHQVKIRGFRIELGEIEARLQAQPQVREALVLAQEGATGQQLVAYLIPAAEVALEQQAGLRAQLREQLKEALPDYMVPAHLLLLDRWPLTANGKLDRKALPKADASLLQQAYNAPQGALEQALATLWQTALNVERISRDDHFFELGGHSLLAIQLLASIKQELGLAVRIQDLLAYPRIDLLAAHLGREHAGASPCIVPLNRPATPLPALFCIHPSGGMVFSYQPLARCLEPQACVYGVQHRGGSPAPAERQGWQAMIADYTAQIRQAQPSGPYRLMGWSLGGSIAWDIARQLEQAGCEVAFLGLVDSTLPEAQLSRAAFPPHTPRPARHSDTPGQRELQDTVELFGLLFPQAKQAAAEQLHANPTQDVKAFYQWATAHLADAGSDVQGVLASAKAQIMNAQAFDIHDQLEASFADFTLTPLRVKPSCWWSQVHKSAAHIHAAEQVIRQFCAGGELDVSLHSPYPHETMMLEQPLIDSFIEAFGRSCPAP